VDDCWATAVIAGANNADMTSIRLNMVPSPPK
jgi:hypothetical protein